LLRTLKKWKKDSCAFKHLVHPAWHKKRIMCTKGIHRQVSIATLDRYPRSTSQSLLNQHPNQYSVDTWLTVDQQSVDSQLSVDQLICISQKLVTCQLAVDWDVNSVSTEVSIEVWLRVFFEGIDWHSTGDAFSTHDPKKREKKIWHASCLQMSVWFSRCSLTFHSYKVLNKAEIIKQDAVQQCKDEVNIQVRIWEKILLLQVTNVV